MLILMMSSTGKEGIKEEKKQLTGVQEEVNSYVGNECFT
tara:strand:+ start:343 stop:459 length:117 start_codon:yes stop_codon:yes gene_type:complete